MAATVVKRAFKYRFYPAERQARELLRTFGCVRLVYNRALRARIDLWHAEQRRLDHAATSAMLTGWKRDPELLFLTEVSSVPLQQTLRHLQTAFTNFFAKRARSPRFKSRKKSRASAEYTRSGFWFPSSKACSACGQLIDRLPLNVREWTCPGCGQLHDRDVNAARNTPAAGLAATACGAGARPIRHSSVRHLAQPPFAETEAGIIGRETDGQVKIRLSPEGL